jgi:hypothetical protein
VHPFGENENFEWEGFYNVKPIKVLLLGHTSVERADISRELPNWADFEIGNIRHQFYSELTRILRQIN